MNATFKNYIERLNIINKSINKLDINTLNDLYSECNSMENIISNIFNKILECKKNINKEINITSDYFNKKIKNPIRKKSESLLDSIKTFNIKNLNDVEKITKGELYYIPQLKEYVYNLNGKLIYGNLYNITNKTKYKQI